MDLKQKIEKTIMGMKLDTPVVDISCDDNGNVYGYVCSKTFDGEQDERVQEKIWSALKKKLSEQELIKIMLLINETPAQRLMRMDETPKKAQTKYDTCLWVHRCPDMANYWLFIGITNDNSVYSASYFWIDDSDKEIGNGLILTYPEDVLKFMRLEQSEIVPEIYDNAIGNAESEIKTKIMEKYNLQTKQGRWGGSNIYHYVFTSFELEPVPVKGLLLSNEIASRMAHKLNKLPSSFQKSEVMSQLERIKKVNATARRI